MQNPTPTPPRARGGAKGERGYAKGYTGMPDRKKQAPWHSPPDAWDATKPLARHMRREPTAAERVLWDELRAHRFLGLGFRRQHSLDWFVADFYCPEARQVIEVDGGGHDAQQEQDAWRDANVAALNLQVLRFRNEEVLHALPVVLGKIAEALGCPTDVLPHEPTSLPLSARGEGARGRGSRSARGEAERARARQEGKLFQDRPSRVLSPPLRARGGARGRGSREGAIAYELEMRTNDRAGYP